MRALIGFLLALAAPLAAEAAVLTLDSTRSATDSGVLRQARDGAFYLHRSGARNSRSIQTLALGPGEYEITLLSGAWNRWGRTTSDCDAMGANCARGWESSFAYFVAGSALDAADVTPVNWARGRERGSRFATAQDAADSVTGRVIERFALPEARDIGFFIPDDYIGDNRGAVTLRVERAPTSAAVPLSATIWMVGLGLAGLVAVAARRGARRA